MITPAGRDAPWIDVEEVASEVGDLAAVFLSPTGSFTQEFSRRMAEGTQVYGDDFDVTARGRPAACPADRQSISM